MSRWRSGLGVAPDRIDTIVDRAGAPQYGIKIDGNGTAASAEVMGELAAMIVNGQLEFPSPRPIRSPRSGRRSAN